MEYAPVKDFAARWEISQRRLQSLCASGRVEGAVKTCGVWMIPNNAIRPMRLSGGKKTDIRRTPLKVLSLFSGCGGMDLGFEGGFDVLAASVNTRVNPHWKIRQDGKRWAHLPKTRFHTVFANDIRPDAMRAWTAYFGPKYGIPKADYHDQSVVDLVKLQKSNRHSIFPASVDVVTGGFPCQDFSVAGKRMGFDSDKSHTGGILEDDAPSAENRGQLYMWMREVIGLTQPKIFIAENVKGLTNLGDAKRIIEKDFASVCDGGYLVIPARVLLAADYGVPQSRERVIFYGFRRSALRPEALAALSEAKIAAEYDPYPPVTHCERASQDNNNLLPFVTLRKAFVGLREPEKAKDENQTKYSKAKYMGRHCQGQNEVDLNWIGPTIRAEHHGNIEYRRLSAEHGGRYLGELAAGKPERRLTVRECARIQTFPDDYHFILPADQNDVSVSASDAYRLIGNALPPLLAYHIAKRIESNWDRYFA